MPSNTARVTMAANRSRPSRPPSHHPPPSWPKRCPKWPAWTRYRMVRSLSGSGEDHEKLEHAVVLGADPGEARVRDVPAGERDRDRPVDVDVGAVAPGLQVERHATGHAPQGQGHPSPESAPPSSPEGSSTAAPAGSA